MQMLHPFTRKTIQQIKQISNQLVFFPLLSNVFERVIHNQFGKYMDTFLKSLLCCLGKTTPLYSISLFKLLQQWHKELDNSGLVGTILMDLSKEYECLRHDLIITQFDVYGLSKSSSSLLLEYLTLRKQKEKIGSSYSVWNESKRVVPQVSILGSLLFNVFIDDIFMFIEKTEVCNFVHDNTIYECGEDFSNILENLKHNLKILLKWFRINSLQANTGKLQFMILRKKKRNSVKLKMNSTKIGESKKIVFSKYYN